MKKDKPIPILLRGKYTKLFERLKKYYETKVGTVFSNADIVRIALNELDKKVLK